MFTFGSLLILRRKYLRKQLLARTMKFSVLQQGPDESRLGNLSELWKDSEKIGDFQTPLCLLYSRAGSIPHLTNEVLQYLNKPIIPVVFPLPSIVGLIEPAKKYGHGIGKFVGLEEYPVYISVQDPVEPAPSGYNDKSGISVWSTGGRVRLNVDQFMAAVESFRPAFYQVLCDSDTPQDSSRKRLTHSVERSLVHLDKCLEKHLRSDKLKNTAVFGSVVGGFSPDARKKSAMQTVLRPVDGFVIDGFHWNNSDLGLLNTFEQMLPILKETVTLLPSDKPRVLHGVLPPDMILEAIKCGIDLFDASYAFAVTERGGALMVPVSIGNSPGNILIKDGLKPLNSHFKYEIDLKNEIYREDFSPILEGCACYTCRQFSKAYIHHLLNTSEMLAFVLLMLHNLHNFLSFFSIIRELISKGELDKLQF
ncbi:queuine tRNA-ribosyltransferase accessory subunit 2-like [Limulus polyphemus]|uniref:Queuine tRNA-ribosyltransferase accessory subunit 2 n=1 Tax=Limulus polyphemus TaxID=6850 RepID=A0ABM1B7S0_LIMPO|nr:queuine tRNA-ribosyltransferase accessory subunit 2-like [Limulus polyphemus]